MGEREEKYVAAGRIIQEALGGGVGDGLDCEAETGSCSQSNGQFSAK